MSQAPTQTPTIYDFEAKSISGKDIALSDFKGQVMLIVNTASKCGFTPQFGGLEALHKTVEAWKKNNIKDDAAQNPALTPNADVSDTVNELPPEMQSPNQIPLGLAPKKKQRLQPKPPSTPPPEELMR